MNALNDPGFQSIYLSLNESRREIRLANILASRSERVEITLSTVSLDDKPVYDALSYCWGDPSIQRPIYLNGQLREVTANLETALQRLRPEADSQSVVLWADAICINQSDTDERSQQVSIMPDIYRSACRVNAWFGELPADTADAFERIVIRAAKRHIVPHSLERSEWTYEDTNRVMQELSSILLPDESVHDLSQSLRHLEQTTYWSRKWIIQEAALAKSFRVYMGSNFIDLADDEPRLRWARLSRILAEFSNALFTYVYDDHKSSRRDEPDSKLRLEIYRAFHELHGKLYCIATAWTRAFPVDGVDDSSYRTALDLQLINASRATHCSDPRDSVFAIQGLLSTSTTIQPDYSATPENIFERFTMHVIRTTKSLAILDFACSYKDSLLSWVPDFTLPAPKRLPDDAHASVIDEINFTFTQPGPGQLQVPALVVGKIVSIINTPDRGLLPGAEYVADLYARWNGAYHDLETRFRDVRQPDGTDIADLDRFWETLDAGYGGMADANGDFSVFKECLKTVQDGTYNDPEGAGNAVKLILDFAETFDLFFISPWQFGALRKENDSIESEDSVMLIASAKMPFCVRATGVEAESEVFKLLNTCYLAGISFHVPIIARFVLIFIGGMHGEIVRLAGQYFSCPDDNLDAVFELVTLV